MTLVEEKEQLNDQLRENDDRLRNRKRFLFERDGQKSESLLWQDEQYKNLQEQRRELQTQKQEITTNIKSARRKLGISNEQKQSGDARFQADLLTARDDFSGILGGINPMGEAYAEMKRDERINTPEVTPSGFRFSDMNPNRSVNPVSQTGRNMRSSYNVGEKEEAVIEDILDRQQDTRIANEVQTEYYNRLNAGEIPVEEAIANPRTAQRQYKEGVLVREVPVDPNVVAREPRYTREEILAERAGIRSRYYDSPVETFVEQELSPVDKVQLAIMEAGYTSNVLAETSMRHEVQGNIMMRSMFGDTITPMEMAVGNFAKGASNTFGSYLNMGVNLGNFAQGKELEPNTRPPIQDSFFGAIAENDLDNFYATQSKRDPYMIAGELVTEGLIWALPLGASFGMGVKGSKFASNILSPFMKTATKAEPAVPTTKGMFLRDPPPRDVYSKDTATPMEKSVTKELSEINSFNADVSKMLENMKKKRVPFNRRFDEPKVEKGDTVTKEGLIVKQETKTIQKTQQKQKTKQETKQVEKVDMDILPVKPMTKTEQANLQYSLQLEKQLKKQKKKVEQEGQSLLNPQLVPLQNAKQIQEFQFMRTQKAKQKEKIKPIVKQQQPAFRPFVFPTAKVQQKVQPKQKQPLMPLIAPLQTPARPIPPFFMPPWFRGGRIKKGKNKKSKNPQAWKWQVPELDPLGVSKGWFGAKGSTFNYWNQQGEQLGKGYKKLFKGA